MDRDILIQLGKRFGFNVLPVMITKETEKAFQLTAMGSERFLWVPKKALKEDRDVNGLYTLQSWFKLDNWAEIFISSNMRRPFSFSSI